MSKKPKVDEFNKHVRSACASMARTIVNHKETLDALHEGARDRAAIGQPEGLALLAREAKSLREAHRALDLAITVLETVAPPPAEGVH